MKKNFTQALYILITVLLQISVIQPLPAPMRYCSLPLAIILLYIIREKYNTALNWALWSGILMGLYQYQRFGADAMIFLTIAIFINFLYNNIFTNTSIISLAFIEIIAQIAYIILSWLMVEFLFMVNIQEFTYKNFFRPSLLINQILANVIFFIIIYKLLSINRGNGQEKY